MSSACLERALRACLRALAAMALLFGAAAACAQAPLRVCADPDNMPLSHASGAGLEDRLAVLLAHRLGRPLEHAWLPDRRGFVGKTLLSGVCDLLMGVPQGLPRVATTQPYYRSAFVFAGPAGVAPLAGFDDPRLPGLRLGVQLIGIDPGTSPVGYALARAGATAHVHGYTVFDGPGSAAERMMAALARGELDGALLWGAQAGYYVRRSGGRLQQTALAPPPAMAGLPFGFGVAMAVRTDDQALLQALDALIADERCAIDGLLEDYGVYRTDAPAQGCP